MSTVWAHPRFPHDQAEVIDLRGGRGPQGGELLVTSCHKPVTSASLMTSDASLAPAVKVVSARFVTVKPLPLLFHGPFLAAAPETSPRSRAGQGSPACSGEGIPEPVERG